MQLAVVRAEPVSELWVCDKRAPGTATGMASPKASKRTFLPDFSNPLSDAGILELVLEYVGPRVWLYVGTVSGLWRQCYEKVTLEIAKREALDRCDGAVVTGDTTYEAAFQSVATLTWAHANGLKLNDLRSWLSARVQLTAGRHASLLTLVAAHELGLPMSGDVFAGAVASGREPIVDYLYTTHHCPIARDIGYSPAREGNISMLRYLKQRGFELTRARLCCSAARAGHLDTMKFLRDEGYTWRTNEQIVGWAAQSGNLKMVS
jgi:hypothetical protein